MIIGLNFWWIFYLVLAFAAGIALGYELWRDTKPRPKRYYPDP